MVISIRCMDREGLHGLMESLFEAGEVEVCSKRNGETIAKIIIAPYQREGKYYEITDHSGNNIVQDYLDKRLNEEARDRSS